MSQPGLLFFKEIIICLISVVVVGGIYILCYVISMYDIGLTLHDIVLDSLEPTVVKNQLNSFAIISLLVTVLPLMQKLILRDVLLIPNYGFKDSPGLCYIAFIKFQLSTIIQNLSIPQVRGKLVTLWF